MDPEALQASSPGADRELTALRGYLSHLTRRVSRRATRAQSRRQKAALRKLRNGLLWSVAGVLSLALGLWVAVLLI